MAAPEPLYDLMLLLDTSAPEEQRKKVLSDVESAISSAGSIVGTHDWGTRPLAYEIRHRADAEYHLLQFQGGPEVPAALDRYLRIADGVVRFRVIKLRGREGAVPDLTASASEPVASEAPAEAAPVERL